MGTRVREAVGVGVLAMVGCGMGVISAAVGLLLATKPPLPVSSGSPMKKTAARMIISTIPPPIILILFTRGFAGASGFPGDKNSASSTVSDDPRFGGAGTVTGFFASFFIEDGVFGVW